MAFFVLILLGFIGGIPAGMGMGGGTVTIPLLTLFGGVEQKIAQSANLFSFFFAWLFEKSRGKIARLGGVTDERIHARPSNTVSSSPTARGFFALFERRLHSSGSCEKNFSVTRRAGEF